MLANIANTCRYTVAFIFFLLLCFADTALSQFKIDLGEGRDLQISQMLQFWDAYSFKTAGADSTVDSRNDVFFRRARLAFEGHIKDNLSFNVMLAYDGIAKDPYTATAGSPNADDNHDLYLWEASWMWSVDTLLNLTFGYFRPQVGKEQMSSEFYVISFDKSFPDGQPRLCAHQPGLSLCRRRPRAFAGGCPIFPGLDRRNDQDSRRGLVREARFSYCLLRFGSPEG